MQCIWIWWSYWFHHININRCYIFQQLQKNSNLLLSTQSNSNFTVKKPHNLNIQNQGLQHLTHNNYLRNILKTFINTQDSGKECCCCLSHNSSWPTWWTSITNFVLSWQAKYTGHDSFLIQFMHIVFLFNLYLGPNKFWINNKFSTCKNTCNLPIIILTLLTAAKVLFLLIESY